MATNLPTEAEVRFTLSECQHLTEDIKRRKFALLYTEWDGSICRAEGFDDHVPSRVLYLVRETRECKTRIAEWMRTCAKGSYWIVGTRSSCVVIRTA